MREKLKWPITEDMVGTEVVFKGYRRGHRHWVFKLDKVYIIEKHSIIERYGIKDEDGDMPRSNYDETFMFEIVSRPVPTKLKWYQRLINWFKGV